jgi:two-component system, sensor histidine kinase and response regulator
MDVYPLFKSMANKRFMSQNYSVLVVDDSNVNREFIGSLLRKKGISIVFATNGREALEVASAKMPDLILLDVIMPELDGYEVCERLKNDETTKDIPVIFLTSKNQTEDLIKGFAFGAVDYVNKPFKEEELVSRVITHLELKKSRDTIEEQRMQLKLTNASILEHSKTVEKLNTKLRDQNELLQETIHTKDKFFSIISHDLKGPLGLIISFTDLILNSFDKFDKDRMMGLVQQLKNSTITSTKLLENLLEWARSQTGELKRNPVKLDICHVLKKVMQTEIETARLKKLIIEMTECEGTFVYADESMLNTVLRNLISNAIKFTSGGGSISIYYKTIKSESEDYVEVEIKDTGRGIDTKVLPDLFKINKNRSTAGTDGEKGTGLGLILCRELVEKNKGSISVKSKLGEGSSFIFTVPVYKEKNRNG